MPRTKKFLVLNILAFRVFHPDTIQLAALSDRPLCCPLPSAMHPIAALALARVRTLALDDRSTVPCKWRPLISRYHRPTDCWSLSPDGAYALLQDDWECLHVLPLHGSERGPVPELQFAAPHEPHANPAEVICAVADSGAPAALRHFLFAGRQVNHIERCNAWVQEREVAHSAAATAPSTESVQALAPAQLTEVLSHWYVMARPCAAHAPCPVDDADGTPRRSRPHILFECFLCRAGSTPGSAPVRI